MGVETVHVAGVVGLSDGLEAEVTLSGRRRSGGCGGQGERVLRVDRRQGEEERGGFVSPTCEDVVVGADLRGSLSELEPYPTWEEITKL